MHSSNRAAVHLLQRVGLRPTIDLAARMGLDSMPAVPSLALGTGEVSLLNLTSAYTVFVNGGILQSPTFIRRVEDADGRVLYRAPSEGHRVLSETTAFLMASMLADVVDHGTGYSARAGGFRLPAGGKTGFDRRPQRRVVRRLHAESRGRRVDGIRSPAADHAPRLCQRRGGAGMGRLHEGRDQGQQAPTG